MLDEPFVKQGHCDGYRPTKMPEVLRVDVGIIPQQNGQVYIDSCKFCFFFISKSKMRAEINLTNLNPEIGYLNEESSLKIGISYIPSFQRTLSVER